MSQPIQNVWRAVLGVILFLLPGHAAAAQFGAIPQQPLASSDAQQNTQSISRTGLLPVYALDLQIDPSWVDGMSAPSNSPQFSHNGVNDTLQQAWDTVKKKSPQIFMLGKRPTPIEQDAGKSVSGQLYITRFEELHRAYQSTIVREAAGLYNVRSDYPGRCETVPRECGVAEKL